MDHFVERFGIWSADQRQLARDVVGRIEAEGVEVVRFAWADQHGILRGKTLLADAVESAFGSGVSLTSTLLAKDTSHRSVFPVFSVGGGFGMPEMQGGGDFVIVADPSTFKILPWAPHTGWVLCDAYMKDGRRCPFDTRNVMRQATAALDARQLDFLAGLEVEFHAFRNVAPNMGLGDSGQPGVPPGVALLTHGYQYLTELRYDQVQPLMALLRQALVALQLPLRSLEVEFGPSQFELVFGAEQGMKPADTMVLLRSAIKQVCQRNGYHATFMCRPRIPNVMSSGWHLHQSLRDRASHVNAFTPRHSEEALSALGMAYLGGLKRHARGCAALASPTINGYRRYRPFSLAPDRATWARDNRAAMLRVLGGAGDETSHIENRVGEPAANPYLYLASQIRAGLHGIEEHLDPGASVDAPYEAPDEPLPRSLSEALRALREDTRLCRDLGEDFVGYYCYIKEAEVARFSTEVTEWEQREYFDIF